MKKELELVLIELITIRAIIDQNNVFMKRNLIIYILIFSVCTQISFTQSNNTSNESNLEDFFLSKMPLQLDTIFYPFYMGIQMIEIDHIGFWDRKIFFLEQSQPRAIPHSAFNPMPIGNEFIFRDSSGTILKAFNSKQTLTELTNTFKKVPLRKKNNIFGNTSTSHKNRIQMGGIWYQSPQIMFNFSGFYKISNGYAEQLPSQDHYQKSGQTSHLKYGLIDSLGNIVVPVIYDAILPYYDNLLVQKDTKWGIITFDNKIVISPNYDSYEFDYYNQSNNRDERLNLFFLTSIGTDVYNPKYRFDALFLSKTNKLITLNTYDEVKHENSWNPIKDKEKRFIPVTKNDKIGMLNENYEEIVPPNFEIFEFNRYTNTLFRVSSAGKFGFWDINLKEIIPLEFDYAESFQDDSTALVLKDKMFYRIDSKNKKVSKGKINPSWKIGYLDFILDKNFLSVQTNDFLGIVDTSTNSIILPFVYNKQLKSNQISSFYARKSNQFEQLQLLLGDKPDMIDEILFLQNKIIVKNAYNRYGVIDTTFNFLIDTSYENLKPISSNLNYLIYVRNGKSGAMDYTEKKLLTKNYEEIKYDEHYEQERDIFKVKLNGKWGVVDFENTILVPFEYDSIKFLGHWNRPKEKLWVVGKDKRFGVIDEKNALFIPFKYHGISHLAGNTLWVENEEKVRYKVVIE